MHGHERGVDHSLCRCVVRLPNVLSQREMFLKHCHEPRQNHFIANIQYLAFDTTDSCFDFRARCLVIQFAESCQLCLYLTLSELLDELQPLDPRVWKIEPRRNFVPLVGLEHLAVTTYFTKAASPASARSWWF